MHEKVGLIVKAKNEIFPDSSRNEPVKPGTKGMIYSVLPENFEENDEAWFVIFQSGEAMDFNTWEQRYMLELTGNKISGSDKNRIYNKKMEEVIQDVKKKRIKL